MMNQFIQFIQNQMDLILIGLDDGILKVYTNEFEKVISNINYKSIKIKMNIEETKNFVKKAHKKQLRKYPKNTSITLTYSELEIFFPNMDFLMKLLKQVYFMI